MDSENRQERIKNVQAQCELHWLVNRIPQERAEEMGDELGHHLEEAVRDGKTVEDVVGSDVYVFAESWAEEDRPAWTAKDSVVEYAFALSFLTAFMATVFHLFRWELSIPVHWLVTPELLFFAWLLGRSPGGAASQDTQPRWKRWALFIGAILLVIVAWYVRDVVRPITENVGVAIADNANGTLFTWPWYGTVAVVLINLVVGKVKK